MTDPISPIPPPGNPGADGRRMRLTLRLRKLVGPGASEFYQDACILMDNSLRLSSTSHLVGHLIREIESSLRDVLQPLAQEAGTVGEMSKKDKEERHKFQIRSILTLLNIPLEDEVAQTYFRE
jgi:hypothetical protein